MAAMASAMDVIFHVDCSSTEPGLGHGEYFHGAAAILADKYE